MPCLVSWRSRFCSCCLDSLTLKTVLSWRVFIVLLDFEIVHPRVFAASDLWEFMGSKAKQVAPQLETWSQHMEALQGLQVCKNAVMRS